MRYKVGQKVRVRKDLEVGEEYGAWDFAEEMKQHIDKILTITKVDCDYYHLKDDLYEFNWTDEMLEPVEQYKGTINNNQATNTYKFDTDIIEYKGKKYDVCDCGINDYGFNAKIVTFIVKEHKEEILDEAEKRYLSAVIRPFRNKIKFIKKLWLYSGYVIYIKLPHESFELPIFKDERMYKGMKLDKKYSIDDLGL